MKIPKLLIAAIALILAVSSSAGAKNKKKQPERGMLESMQSVPCGVNERGLAGVGSIFGSVGVQHVNSHEKLCPQYLLRTDEMEYHIRPLETKHPVLLPVGHEGEFKIKKDKLFLKVVDQDKKTRPYQVVSMEPVNSGGTTENSSYRPATRLPESRPPETPADKTARQMTDRPPR